MAKKKLPIEKILTLLQTNPQTIAEQTAVFTPAQLRTPPNEGEWSALEILIHLRSCADVWGGCIDTIITEDKPTFHAINSTTWLKSNDYPEREFQPSFHAFTTQRTKLLLHLNSLTPEDWLRAATVKVAGKPYERTVQFYAQWLAEHERSHLKQFKHIVKAISGKQHKQTDQRRQIMDDAIEKSTQLTAWPKGISAITLFVEDMEAAKGFYQMVFELPLIFEDNDSTVFNFGGTLVNLLKTTAVPELIEPATITNPHAGHRFVFTIEVDDVDAMCAQLTERGVKLLNGPVDRPWGVRTASFIDPGGHIWEIAK